MLAMRLLIAALVLTFLVAAVASVFAIWPVVADAPWEDGTTKPKIEQFDSEPASIDPRCETAISINAQATVALAQVQGISIDAYNARNDLGRAIDAAERNIERYC